MGNLVWWELVRLARRGHTARARVLLLYTMLLGGVVFASWHAGNPLSLLFGTADPLPPAEIGRFAHQLAFALLEAQLVLVAVATPAYAVAAVSEEKDRGTLQLLLTTEVTDGEIVWAKAVARVAFMLATLAAGLPLLMLTLLLGADPGLVANGYALAVGTTVLAGAIGVHAACHAPDGRAAMIRAYVQSAVLVGGVFLPPLVLLSPFAMLFYRLGFDSETLRVAAAVGYPVAQVLVGCVLVRDAGRVLRRGGATAGPPPPTAFPEPPRGRPEPVVIDLADLPPERGEIGPCDPVLWKERTDRVPPLPWVRPLGTLAVLLAAALFVAGGWSLLERTMRALDPAEALRRVQMPAGTRDPSGPLLVAAGAIAGWLYLLPLAVGVTGCVAGERFRGTLDALLTTALDRRGILGAKVRVQIEQRLGFAAWAAAALGAGFGAEGGPALGLAVVAGFGAGAGLVVALGAWLTVRCATPVTAFRMCLPALVAVGAIPVLAWYFTDWEHPGRATAVLAWGACGSLIATAACAWRAGAEMERGT
jgi:ABC-type Na+ efflux pump permease subunit